MHTISNEVQVGRRRRREHSAEFKARVVAACSVPGVSIAAVAMANGLNANLARRWVRDAERSNGAQLTTVAGCVAAPAFVPLRMSAAAPAPADIRIELRRGAVAIKVSWPSSAAPECAAWMRELLR